MDGIDRDTVMRMAAFEHVRRLSEVHDHLTATELKPGFVFEGERIPLINPQRGIFKPQQMRFLLSIKTVFPKPGSKVWYDDQREVHRQVARSRGCRNRCCSTPLISSRAARPAGGSERHPAVENSSCGVRCASDRHRPGLSAACVRTAARAA
jgi:hypothetical protein